MNNSLEIKVLALARGDWQTKRFMNFCCRENWKVYFDSTWKTEVIESVNPDIILTLADSYYEIYKMVLAAREKNIPTLLIMDGLLEWRHTWENNRFGYGGSVPLYQPVECDKIACYGWQNARTLESWGNVGKCEIVGDPRFDVYLGKGKIPHAGPKRILIISANTPGYNDTQKYFAKQGFNGLQEYFRNRRDVEVIWRLRKGLDIELGVEEINGAKYGTSLSDILPNIDCAISQASTVVLEPMLVRVPTAIIDFSNSPQYIYSVWNISAHSQIEQVVNEIVNPSAKCMSYQDELLHNQLECWTPAQNRLVKLVEEMAVIGRKSRDTGMESAYPGRILTVDVGGASLPSELFVMSQLYPDHPVLSETGINRLRLELIYANQELKYARNELEVRNIKYWISLLFRNMARLYAQVRKS